MLRDLFDRQHEAETQDMVADNEEEIRDERWSLIHLLEYTFDRGLDSSRRAPCTGRTSLQKDICSL
jgi:hypothetical protein